MPQPIERDGVPLEVPVPPTRLTQLSPKPDAVKAARPPTTRLNTVRGKAAATLATDNAAVTTRDPLGQTSKPSTNATPSPRFGRTLTSPGKSGPVVAPTKMNITKTAMGQMTDETRQESKEDKSDMPQEKVAGDPVPVVAGSRSNELKEEPLAASSWGGWFTKSYSDLPPQSTSAIDADNKTPNEESVKATADPAHDVGLRKKSSLPAPELVPLPAEEDPDDLKPVAAVLAKPRPRSWLGLWSGNSEESGVSQVEGPRRDSASIKAAGSEASVSHEQGESSKSVSQQPPVGSSWFGLWGGTHMPTSTGAPSAVASEADPGKGNEETQGVKEAEVVHLDVAQAQVTQSMETSIPVGQGSSYGSWLIWPRGGTGNTTDVAPKPVTEGGPTEASSVQPQPETASTPNGAKLNAKATASPTQPVSKVPIYSGIGAAVWEGIAPRILSTSSAPTTPPRSATPQNGNENPTPSKINLNTKDALDKAASKGPPNLVLPIPHNTFTIQPPPTYKAPVYGLMKRQHAPSPSQHHVYLERTPRIVKKALAIGIHGFFPAAWFQSLFGKPTGTSTLFAQLAADAIERWSLKTHRDSCEIEKIELTGEGFVADRVEALWKLLLNWTEQIKKADLIVIAAHSQGSPVSTMIMARLLEGDYLNHNARLGVISMAGIFLGPFPSLETRFLSPVGSSAHELFSLGNMSSAVSKQYAVAMDKCLASGVRVSCIASLDDALIPLDSALYITAKHANLFRTAFIDSKVYAPSFLTHLLELTLKCLNLGGLDHGLIHELSLPLAGSLSSGGGHSNIYQDPAVYDVGVSWTLDSADLNHPADLVVRQEYEPPNPAGNPYLLPWALRGMLDEDIVKTSLQEEATELVRLFNEWQPTTKVLKDVKYRLEAVSRR